MNRDTNKEIDWKVKSRKEIGKGFPLKSTAPTDIIDNIKWFSIEDIEEHRLEERKRTLEEVEKAKEVINTRWLEYIKLSFNIVKIGMPFFPFCPKCSCLHPIKVWYGDGNHTCVSCGYTDDNRKFIAI